MLSSRVALTGGWEWRLTHWTKLLNKAVLLELFMIIWSRELFGETFFFFLQSISQKHTGSLWLAGQLKWLNRKPFYWTGDVKCRFSGGVLLRSLAKAEVSRREDLKVAAARGTFEVWGAVICFNEHTCISVEQALSLSSTKHCDYPGFLPDWKITGNRGKTLIIGRDKGNVSTSQPFKCLITLHTLQQVQIFETIYWNFITKVLQAAVITWLPEPEVPASEGYLVS